MSGRATTWLIIALAAGTAWLGATDRPGGWNDGSRLATVECLVDYGTWAIDDSIFCTPRPYGEGVAPAGTLDKLFIQGHYYSDKSPVPALLMAGPYWLWRQCGGPAAAERPDLFCYFMTLISAGLAYILAVAGIDELARRSLVLPLRLAITASFALATIALAYSRSVNNHILLLAVATWMLVGMDQFRLVLFTAFAVEKCSYSPPPAFRSPSPEGEGLGERVLDSTLSKPLSPNPSPRKAGGRGTGRQAEEMGTGRQTPRAIVLGTLAGLAYTIDLGVGPVLALGAALLVAWRLRFSSELTAFVLAALPWVTLHHALNYHIGGTLRPANANPEYFQWAGCPFNQGNLTGSWNHQSLLDFFLYAFDTLVGKRGFLGHNLALYLAVPAAFLLLRRPHPKRAELWLCTGWCLGTWLIYAATSNNMSGECCSVRWFVPLIATGYYILIRLLRERPEFTIDFLALSGIGSIIGLLSWYRGPWTGRMVPGYWGLIIAAALAWGWAARARRHATSPPARVLHRAA